MTLRDRLASLLYYRFLDEVELGRPAGDSARSTLGLAPSGDDLAFAVMVAAILSGLIGPGYLPDTRVVRSREAAGVVLDTIHETLPMGVVDVIVAERRLCTPENMAARLLAEEALAILRDRGGHSVAGILNRLLTRSWLARVSGCGRTDSRKVLSEALERIVSGAAPPRFKSLLPVITHLLEEREGRAVAYSRRPPWTYSDVYAELEALASILDSYDISVTREAARRGYFAKDGVVVCHQHPLMGRGGCSVEPDIIVVDSENKTLWVVEVKSVGPGEDAQARLAERLTEARRQLAEYVYALSLGWRSCGTALPADWRVVGVIAYKAPGDLRATPHCAEEMGFLVTPTHRVGPVVRGERPR